MAANRESAATIGRAAGITTENKIRVSLAPSILAASISDRGTDSKYVRARYKPTGDNDVARMTPASVPDKCSRLITTNSGTISDIRGIITPARSSSQSTFLNGKRYVANAYPAMHETSTEIPTVPTNTITVFAVQRRIMGEDNRRP